VQIAAQLAGASQDFHQDKIPAMSDDVPMQMM
jgi:hypothetical protein